MHKNGVERVQSYSLIYMIYICQCAGSELCRSSEGYSLKFAVCVVYCLVLYRIVLCVVCCVHMHCGESRVAAAQVIP